MTVREIRWQWEAERRALWCNAYTAAVSRGSDHDYSYSEAILAVRTFDHIFPLDRLIREDEIAKDKEKP